MDQKEFNTEIDKAFQAAWHTEKGGGADWNNYLQSYGVQPLGPDEKESLMNSEVKIVKGAFPIELRRVYQKVLEKYSTDPQMAPVVNAFDMDGKIKEYYQKIKPFSGMSDIFKNASGSSMKYSQGMKKERHYTIRCKNCAAPRLEENQYDECLFCGSKLFEPIK